MYGGSFCSIIAKMSLGIYITIKLSDCLLQGGSKKLSQRNRGSVHTPHDPRHGGNDDHRGRKVAVAFFSSLQQWKECNGRELAKSALLHIQARHSTNVNSRHVGVERVRPFGKSFSVEQSLLQF